MVKIKIESKLTDGITEATIGDIIEITFKNTHIIQCKILGIDADCNFITVDITDNLSDIEIFIDDIDSFKYLI